MATVYFATNRQVTNTQDAVNGYPAVMVPPLQASGRARMARITADTTAFPSLQFMLNDCGAIRDYDFDPMTSHQYYRMSPTVRATIASQMAGVC